MDPSLSIVVPCYNEAENIPVVFPPLLEFAKERGWRVVAVDDGSRDETRALLMKMKETAQHLDVVCHKLNRGYGAATKTGLRAVETEYAVTIDADGQHRLEDVEKCYRRIVETDADLVVGERVNNESGGYRSLGKWVIRTFASMLLSLPVRDLNSGMKCYRMSEAITYLDLCPDTMAFSDVILLLMVNDRKLVSRTEIEVAPRLAGKSTIGTRTALVTLAEILNLAILLRPLTVFFRIGLVFVLLGLAWGTFIYIKSRTITSAAVMMIMLGVLSFILGLLGEQLAQIRRKLAKR
jgi:glycosyltransferase involved in cell wall biosynthesis